MMHGMSEHIIKVDEGTITTPAGFSVAGLHSGVKRKRNDLGIIYCETLADVAAVFTTNVIQAAPLKVTKEGLAKEGKLRALIVNSGNANACTGEQGEQDARTMRDETAKQFNLLPEHVAVSSTGIIGLAMPMDKIIPHIKQLKPEATTASAAAFNESMLTTDTVKKSTCYEAMIANKRVTMAGAAKGSGMIEPNMATMLSFITTDINIESTVLQKALQEITKQTFNCITVDGDTSTNDTALIMASGLANNDSLTPAHEDWPIFISLLRHTCEDLAKLIARDGEGATKLIEVKVNGAQDDEEAIKVAKSVVGSSLVKTAVYGTDANWGRMIAAVGYSGAHIHPETIDLSIGPIPLLKDSQPLEFSEKEATAYLENEEIIITIQLHVGEGNGKAWGCDLTYDYVQINASYRS